ncbi:DUF4294 domain-containing protein [Halocola ammonii]
MKQILLSISFSLVFLLAAQAQESSDSKSPVLRGHVVDGDTIPMVNLASVVISDSKYHNKRYYRTFARLQRKVVKVYPYAKAAGDLMNEYEKELKKMDSERQRKRYIKKAEAELKEKFEGEIRKMTVSEGLILIRLIDRETGDTSYELISELRGSFSAFMWQSLARLFGNNLKEQYNPEEGEDQIIEEIVRQIESGTIRVKTFEEVTK